MPLYSEEIIQQVREANDIVDVIGSYVTLQKKGSSYFGLCPFHGEKTPSFSVNQREQFFYCFGCHTGGNVITFIMKIENMTFPEALKYLADRAHIDLPEAEVSEEEKKRIHRRERLLSAAKETARFYYYQLTRTPQGKRGLEYLDQRQVTEEYRRKFGLGYSPVSRDMLFKYLSSKGYTTEEMLAAGLVSGREGAVFDRFFNRVMFPIFDTQGRPIAFGGRIMGQGEPKYLNSPDSELFNKRYNLYGLSIAKRSRRDFLMMVEGYMDVLSLHQAGYDNAVASLGTALTSQQALLMKRYTDKVILCYDSDRPGTQAARRAIPILKGAGLDVKVMQVPSGKDPDEFIKDNGAQALEDVIKAALDPVDFELTIQMRDNGDSVDGQIQTLKGMEENLAGIQNDLEREIHIKDVAAKLKLPEETLRKEVENIRQSTGLLEYRARRAQDREETRQALDKQADAAGTLLAALIYHPEVWPSVRTYISMEDFPDKEEDHFHHQAAGYVLGCLDKGKEPVFADLVSCFDKVEDQEAAFSIRDYKVPDDKGELAKFLEQNIISIKNRQIEEDTQSDDIDRQVRAVRLKKELRDLKIYL